MMSKITSLKNLPTKVFDMKETSSNMNLSGIYTERQHAYLNEFSLYLAIFNKIPNFIHEINIDCKKARAWFNNEFNNDIILIHFAKRYFERTSKCAAIDDVFYMLYDDLIVNFDTNQSVVRFFFHKCKVEDVEGMAKNIKKFKFRKSVKPMISLIINSNSGINTKIMDLTKPKLNIDDNYNDDFKEIHKIIIKRLSKKNDKGLVLLHGKPGTGKTSYIRYLISILKKDVIFLPPNMANAITNPDLISILINNSNSVFVIEDAENIVVDREKDGHSPVSALLNISDGLLSDCLNIQIICSFNTDISKVDSALMRKGRLIAKYEFKELEVAKANYLSNKLGFCTEFDKPVPLTAIYNQTEKDFQQIKRNNIIGFRA